MLGSLPIASPDLILPQRADLPSHFTSHCTQSTGRTGDLLGNCSGIRKGREVFFKINFCAFPRKTYRRTKILDVAKAMQNSRNHSNYYFLHK